MKTHSLILSLFATFIFILPLQASAQDVGGVSFARVGVAQGPGAIPFAIQVADYINANYDVNLTVATPIGGVVGTIIWRAEFASLAALEVFNQQILADEGYQTLIAAGPEHFAAGSLQDYISTRIH